MIKIDFDMNALDIIETIDLALATYGLTIVDDEQVHDGFYLVRVEELKEDTFMIDDNHE